MHYYTHDIATKTFTYDIIIIGIIGNTCAQCVSSSAWTHDTCIRYNYNNIIKICTQLLRYIRK